MIFFLSSSGLVAKKPGTPETRSEKQSSFEKALKKLPEWAKKETLIETHHTIQTVDGVLRYKATAGNYILRTEDGRAKASIFFIAYEKEDVKDRTHRPIMFSFNGGPGSSSVWLHLGLLGPKRVDMGEDGHPPLPPGKLQPNPYTLLPVADLVFIDPVTTGYSRAVPGEDPKQFHGVREDIRVVGEFIRLFVTRNKRWASPKFLIGESYGTTRAAGLVNYLESRHGMYFNGVILVSSILNFLTAEFDIGNDLPYILILPTYTATAWYHKKLPRDLLEKPLEEVIQEVENFAIKEYTLALMKGDALSAEEKKSVAEKLARYTGLDVAYILHANLRVEIFRFAKELLRDERKTVGRLDSRFTGYDRDAAGERFEYDPSYAAIQGVFTATLNHYIRDELQYKNDLPYEILTSRVWPWSFKIAENKYLNVAEDLRRAITRNPFLHVFIASGYYDLATPFFATDYTISHLSLEKPLNRNIEIHYYPAGHMMYIHKPSLKKLSHELKSFLKRVLSQREPAPINKP